MWCRKRWASSFSSFGSRCRMPCPANGERSPASSSSPSSLLSSSHACRDMQKSDPRERIDGRRARGENNRQRIVDALLKLVAEGNVAPSADEVAGEAGVALRTGFRHFADMESLYRELSERMRAEIAPIIDRPFEAGEGFDRILDLIHRRAIVFERLLPFKIAGDAHRHASAFLTKDHEALVKVLRGSLAAALPAALRRERALVAALELILSIESWRRLRRDQKLSVRDARATLVFAVARLLAWSRRPTRTDAAPRG